MGQAPLRHQRRHESTGEGKQESIVFGQSRTGTAQLSVPKPAAGSVTRTGHRFPGQTSWEWEEVLGSLQALPAPRLTTWRFTPSPH